MAKVIGVSTDGSTEITDMDHLVSMVSGTGESEYRGIEKAFSVRVPLDLGERLKAMAEHGRVPQNTLICNLLEFAVSEVFQQLNNDVASTINEAANIAVWEAVEAQKKGGAK